MQKAVQSVISELVWLSGFFLILASLASLLSGGNPAGFLGEYFSSSVSGGLVFFGILFVATLARSILGMLYGFFSSILQILGQPNPFRRILAPEDEFALYRKLDSGSANLLDRACALITAACFFIPIGLVLLSLFQAFSRISQLAWVLAFLLGAAILFHAKARHTAAEIPGRTPDFNPEVKSVRKQKKGTFLDEIGDKPASPISVRSNVLYKDRSRQRRTRR